MKFTKVEDKYLQYKKTKNQAFLEEFLEQNIRCAEVTDIEEFKNVNSACCSLQTSARRFKLGVACQVIDGKVYIFNKSLNEVK